MLLPNTGYFQYTNDVMFSITECSFSFERNPCHATVSILHVCFAYYSCFLSTNADRQGVDVSFTVCLFERLRISPAMIKLAASNFARWFMDVLGRESPILGNFAPPEALKQLRRGNVFTRVLFVCSYGWLFVSSIFQISGQIILTRGRIAVGGWFFTGKKV